MNDVNFSGCKFSADIVPYMYGELSATDCSAFESHLLNCGECTDEFAAISNARYEVYDWKKLEFDPLATPRFEIPYETETLVAASWVEKLRAVFAQSWAVPGVAFAGLVIVAVFAASFLMLGDRGVDIAGEDNSNRGPVNMPVAAKTNDTPDVSKDENATISSPVSPTKVEPVKIGGRGRVEQKRAVEDLRFTPTRSVEKKQTSAQNQNPPRLNEFSEDEDTSLRLAELFEDIETSD